MRAWVGYDEGACSVVTVVGQSDDVQQARTRLCDALVAAVAHEDAEPTALERVETAAAAAAAAAGACVLALIQRSVPSRIIAHHHAHAPRAQRTTTRRRA